MALRTAALLPLDLFALDFALYFSGTPVIYRPAWETVEQSFQVGGVLGEPHRRAELYVGADIL